MSLKLNDLNKQNHVDYESFARLRFHSLISDKYSLSASCLLSNNNVSKPNYLGVSEDAIFLPDLRERQEEVKWERAPDHSETLSCSLSQHGTFGFINRSGYRLTSLMFPSYKDRHLFWRVINDHPALATRLKGMLWQMSCWECSFSGHQCGKWMLGCIAGKWMWY